MARSRAAIALASLTAATIPSPSLTDSWFYPSSSPPPPSGTLYLWGGRFGPRPRPAPASLPPVTSAAVSDGLCAAVGTDGAAYILRVSASGSPEVDRVSAACLRRPVAVAVRGDSGEVHVLGKDGAVTVLKDGEVPRVLAGAMRRARIERLSCGARHCVALGSDGSAYAWGENRFGQLGLGVVPRDGEEVEVLSPRKVNLPDGVRVRDVACGGRHTLLLGVDDSVYSCGDDKWAQLGVTAEPWVDGGKATGVVRFAKAVSAEDDGVMAVGKLAAGEDHSAALVRDGVLWTWGANSYGVLGHHNYNSFAPPSPIAKWITASAIVCGRNHSCVLTSNGGVSCIGDGVAGQLGTGPLGKSAVWRDALKAIGGDGRAVGVAAGGNISAAIIQMPP